MTSENGSQQIVNSLEKEMQGKFSAIPNNCETLKQLMKQYSDIINDLLSAKRQYLSVVQKYSDSLKPQINPVLFTGIVTPTPMYSSSEMKLDSQQLIDLGDLVEDLEEQKSLAYSQIQQLLKGIVSDIARATTTAEEIDIFFSQVIQNSGRGVYGSTTMLNATNLK